MHGRGFQRHSREIDESRGGLVNNITYSQICMRDMTNAILVSTAYNPNSLEWHSLISGR